MKCIAKTFFHNVIKKQGSVGQKGGKKTNSIKKNNLDQWGKKNSTMNNFTIFMTVIIIKFK
jgi:hypothetical protein